MARFTVRDYNSSDSAFISGLEKKIFSTPLPYEYISSLPDKENVCFLVCEDDSGDRAGYAGMMWVLDEGSVVSIAVDEKHRNEGVGSMLMNALSERARELGFYSLTLEVRESNLPAIKLYEKTGFELCGRMKNYYSFPREDAVIMTRYFK